MISEVFKWKLSFLQGKLLLVHLWQPYPWLFCRNTCTENNVIYGDGSSTAGYLKLMPLVPDMPHYYVILKSIMLRGNPGTSYWYIGAWVKKGTIIDSETTLVYLAEEAFKPLMNVIFSYQSSLSFHTIQDGCASSVLRSKDGQDVNSLGDSLLSNNLVVYDLEKQGISWADYNCSTSIKVEDARTRSVHNLPFAGRLGFGRFASLLQTNCLMLQFFQ
ncbi:Aspartic proteinase-like protein 2 [Apostasia shenzhenica]|uniref:Aspartic proteinase-like protein 2 n=1 Tax=Apostasia shenzhenica TaxID=1088818 RepID=A0A2I0BDH4_9ASPA|nr:Aspartic proteinase-like protein 2 [Apostasia shenzhenica]